LAAILLFAVTLSASGRKDNSVDSMLKLRSTQTINLISSTFASPGDGTIKDCSKMKTCSDRCLCEYDNCGLGCDNIDDLVKKSKCQNGCTATWNKCTDCK
jgi:hypothetical protein